MPTMIAINQFNEKFKYVSVECSKQNENVLIVTLNRPKKRNAINARMWREIGEVFRQINDAAAIGSTTGNSVVAQDCRCILLQGAGKSFCAGVDIGDPAFAMHDEDVGDAARRAVSFRSKILEMQDAFTALETCPVPVVAAIHGHCIGAGLDLASCADIRICATNTIFSIKEVQLGLAADVGVLQRLPKIVGYGSRVRELCLTGDNFSSDEAHRIGLVSTVVDVDATSNQQQNYSTTEKDNHLMQTAFLICERIAKNSPIAVSGTKQSLNYSRDHSVQEGLEHVALHNSVALMTDDLMLSALSRQKNGKDAPQFQPLLPSSKL
jgi:delta(3,5)-delta(2,4)-dienoyl-CoA isomerase